MMIASIRRSLLWRNRGSPSFGIDADIAHLSLPGALPAVGSGNPV